MMDSQPTQGMKDLTGQNLTLTVPLTLNAHQLAREFCQHHPDPQKAKQVYLNTLAIYAVHSYLSWLGIKTDLPAIDRSNLMMQALSDAADLEIGGQGKLACCPVLPDVTACHISPEVWDDHIGYVAVQFDPALREATLLGFTQTVTVEELPLSQFQPIDALLTQMTQSEAIKQPIVSAINQKINSTAVLLSQWFQNTFAAGWQTVEELLGLQQPELSFRKPVPDETEFITRGKLVHLQSQSVDQQVALLVGLMPTDSNTRQFDIWVKLCPVNHQFYLPENLEMAVLDEQGTAVMQAQSRQTEMLQLKFCGFSGEQFSIQMVWNHARVVETFVI